MFFTKRKISKHTKGGKIKLSLGIILILTGLFAILAFVYLNYYLNSYSYINPISKDTNSQKAKISASLEKSNISYESFSQNIDGSYSVNLKSGALVIFSQNKSLAQQIDSLQLMLSRLTIEGKKLKTIDFRYANPVASF